MTFHLLRSYPSLADAHLARSILVEEGIECFLSDEHLVGANPLLVNAVGGVRLFVAPAELDHAREVLGIDDMTEDVEEERPQRSALRLVVDNAPVEIASRFAQRCTGCGAAKMRALPKLPVFLAVTILAILIAATTGYPDFAWIGLVAGGVIAFALPTMRCSRCGATWRKPAVEIDESPSESDLRVAAEDERCERCGSDELQPIVRKRMKGAGMLLAFVGFILWLPLIVILPFLAKKKCLSCGAKSR